MCHGQSQIEKYKSFRAQHVATSASDTRPPRPRSRPTRARSIMHIWVAIWIALCQADASTNHTAGDRLEVNIHAHPNVFK